MYGIRIYLHLPYKSTIFVATYTTGPMDVVYGYMYLFVPRPNPSVLGVKFFSGLGNLVDFGPDWRIQV